MAETWPATLPQCFIPDTEQEEEGDNLVETPEVAVPKSRPLSSNPARKISGSFRVTREQWLTLRGFGDTTLINYSLPFWFPAASDAGDAAKPGFWLVKFRKDGLPKRSRINSKRFVVSMGFFILP
jgi:hypothetical protein